MSDQSVLFIGPMGVGKTTVAMEVAKALGLTYIDIDELRWDFFERQPDYDETIVAKLFKNEEEIEAFRYMKPFEARFTVDVLKRYRDAVFDFGAGYTVYQDKELFKKVKKAFSAYKNVVYLRYSDDAEDSLDALHDRHTEIPDDLYYALNEEFIKSPCNGILATITIDTIGKSIQEVVETVLYSLRGAC